MTVTKNNVRDLIESYLKDNKISTQLIMRVIILFFNYSHKLVNIMVGLFITKIGIMKINLWILWKMKLNN